MNFIIGLLIGVFLGWLMATHISVSFREVKKPQKPSTRLSWPLDVIPKHLRPLEKRKPKFKTEQEEFEKEQRDAGYML